MLVLLAGVGGVDAKPAAEPAPEPKPSWAAVEDPNQDADPCPTTPPFGWRLEVGWATAKREGDAKALAMEKARKQLLDSACGGVSELRCTSIARHIAPWKTGRWDKAERTACQAMAIEAQVLKAFEEELSQVDRDVAALAKATMDRNGSALLAVTPPRWESGCVAGDLGATLASRLRNALGKNAGARLVPPGSTNPKANECRLTLVPGKDAVTLTAELVRPGESAVTPLPGFDFRLDLFNVAPDEVGECRPDGDLGVEGGERAGTDGLQVWLDVDSRDGLLCEGVKIEPRVRVSRAALVQIYSVSRDGEAYLVWPPPGEAGRVDASASLGENQMVSMPDHGDETLVAVAVDPSAGFGLTRGWSGFCRLKEKFGPASYPATAAVASARYQVLPTGARGCPEFAPVDKEALEQILAAAPMCP